MNLQTTMKLVNSIALCTLLATAHVGQAHEAPQVPAREAAAPQQTDWGIAGDAKKVTRTITLTMTDNMRFTPDRIEVKEGETVRLRVRNGGKMQHELVLGTHQELEAHAAMMLKFPDMEHDEPYMAHVAPGKTGRLVWTFNRAGEFEFACLIGGHYQAGMKGTVRVVPIRGGQRAAATAPISAPETSAQDMHAGAAHNMQHHMDHAMHHAMHHDMQHSSAPARSPSGQPYAGQQQREIKALSDEEIQAYTQGRGFGFAKAAELNGYPGPMHTLELAPELGLSEAQRSQTQALLDQHKAQARRLGAELIEAERELDQAFASRSVDANSLRELTRAAGEKLAALRAEHLQTHLAQTALLTLEQIERYRTLRGYGRANALTMHHPTNPPEMNHAHHPQ